MSLKRKEGLVLFDPTGQIMLVRLFVELPIGVSVSLNCFLSLRASPVIDWKSVKVVSPFFQT